MGILPALNMGRVRTPIPQENLGCFFICQSLREINYCYCDRPESAIASKTQTMH
ncbi:MULTISPECIES: hypothetical protein [unclassified Nostoc]|uniref:hypothetical protein n=1 Tax=unclassified Nostoc TaxID=2593658 RepID=UPI0025F5E7FA|nr:MULTISPECIES: hypothetical protein [unclassified Nostoc]MBN3990012.1 hypothetical protein [Nostoc sp. NMS2]MBN3990013.1 hypothetical protein [Nostoc sp. NMS2]